MNFASLLAQMKKGKASEETNTKLVPIKKTATQREQNQKQLSSTTSISAAKPKYDPAVARLKAARQAERDAAANKKQHKLPLVLKKMPVKISKQEQLQKQILQDKQQQRSLKKLSYKELMQQAAKVDGSKMAITIKSKSTSPEPKIKLSPRKPQPRQQQQPPPPPPVAPKQLSSRELTDIMRQKQGKPPLLRKRQQPRYDEEEEDLSDFVVSEEDELNDYHSEILNIFGRQKRTYADIYSDDDDMEATGADILNEENKSSRMARLEEEREAEIEKLKKLAKLKKFKKN